jgi:hypothetical protein
MRKVLIPMIAMVAGIAFGGLSAGPASALPLTKSISEKQSTIVHVRHGGVRHGGVGIRHGGIRHGGFGIRHGGIRHFHGGHRFHHAYRPRIWVAPVYGYSNGCQWLKRKAIRTGSRYWWNRYNQCRWG